MYVDEAGVEDMQDRTRYFVVSGAVFHEDGLHLMKGAVNRFRENVFADKFGGNKIHVHDIYKGKRGFLGITPQEVKRFLTELYTVINGIEFTAISVVIEYIIRSPYKQKTMHY